MEKISVFLVDWQVLFREGIHFTLSGEDDMDVIGEATNNEEALHFIETNQPRVVILNANHSKFAGVEATRRIKASFPSVSVILIMDSDDEEQLYAALKCGASACLTKEVDPDELVNIIRKVSQGAYPISEVLLRPEIAPRVINEFEASSLISKEVDNLLARLSTRESEILHLIADGKTIEQIAQTLNTNEETIKNHLNQILTKLVSNEHNRDVIEAAQSHLPSMLPRAKPGIPPTEYVTRGEFEAFKESLREYFKSFIGK
jgi:RNA polymerase sigma factor (sigma-70 family)